MKKSELKETIKNALKEGSVNGPLIRGIEHKIKNDTNKQQTVKSFLKSKNVNKLSELEYDDLRNLHSIIYKDDKSLNFNPLDTSGKKDWLDQERKSGRKTGLDETELNEDDWMQPNDESSMAEIQLRSIISNASKLLNIIGDNDQLDSWVQSKLAVAQDMIQAVSDYMSYEE